MSYKWKPSASQRQAFAAKMADPLEQAAYNQRQADRSAKRRAGSKFDYASAGGEYIPTQAQFDFCLSQWPAKATQEQEQARNMVMGAYACKETVHHDYIHIVNELIRATHV